MKPMELNVPGCEIVFNNIYNNMYEDWLDEDLVFIRLPDGTKVEAGWYAKPGTEGCWDRSAQWSHFRSTRRQRPRRVDRV